MGSARKPGLSDEKAARILAGLRIGHTLRRYWARQEQFGAYCKAHPEYAREAKPLLDANTKAARLRKGAHRRDKTHCANGHSFAENARAVVQKRGLTRQCKACELMRYWRGGVMKAEVLEKVTARIVTGSSISSFTTAGTAGYLVKFETLARHRRENPEFDRLVIDATKDSNSRGQLRRWRKIKTGRIREQNNDYYQIRAMLPANFPDRDDIVSNIFEALLSGSLRREDVRTRIRQFINAHGRSFASKYAKFGPHRLLSLDAPLFEDGNSTWGDTATHTLWD
jgi:hypothetical protein